MLTFFPPVYVFVQLLNLKLSLVSFSRGHFLKSVCRWVLLVCTVMLSKVKIETTYLIDKVQNLRNERALPTLRFVWFFVCKEVSFWVLYLENYHILILFFSITKKTETIACILQLYNIRVAHKLITTLRRLLANVKDKDKPEDRQGAVYKIKFCDCQATYIGETGRNLSTQLTGHKQATKKGDVNNHIAEHHLQTKHRIDWDSVTRITYSTDYYQRLTLKSWFTKLEQTPLNHSQQLPAPYKRLNDEIKKN